MKILFYGAGVLGSLYAARLQDSGQDVSVLARGQRLQELREHGILIQDGLKEEPVRATRVNVVEQLGPEDAYDLVVVLVRRQHLPGVLANLANNHNTPNVLFMVSNPSGSHEILSQIARERVLLGFAGGGGVREGDVVRYSLAPSWFQPTTLGELSGLRTPRLERFVQAFRQAGFPVEICPDMDAWLKTHAAWVIPTAEAVYLAGGSVRRLAHTRDGLVLLVRAVRENFQVLRGLGFPITPARQMFWQLTPEPLLVAILARVFDSRLAELEIEQHANAARGDEMPLLAEEFRTLAHRSRLATPSAEQLNAGLAPASAGMPVGSQTLALDWRGAILALWAVLMAFRVFRFFRHRKS